MMCTIHLVQLLQTMKERIQYSKKSVKIAITPMISSLSILNYVEMDSENSVLGYGVSLILLKCWNVSWNSHIWNYGN